MIIRAKIQREYKWRSGQSGGKQLSKIRGRGLHSQGVSLKINKM